MKEDNVRCAIYQKKLTRDNSEYLDFVILQDSNIIATKDGSGYYNWLRM
jgi:hypothetical protein